MVATPSVVAVNRGAGQGSPGGGPAPGIAPITYIIDVENLGSEPASGVVLSDVLPRDTQPVLPLPRGYGLNHSGRDTISCDVGSLAPGQKRTITFAASPGRGGSLTNTATVTMASGPGAPSDPDPSNNQASATVTAVVAPADLRVRMTATPSVFPLGGTPGGSGSGAAQWIVYTIEVENRGPGPIQAGGTKDGRPGQPAGVVLTDVLPAGVVLRPNGLADPRCRVSGGTISCEVGSLAPGDVRTITLSVVPTAAGIVTNTATLVLPSGPDAPRDPDLSNNSASATVVVADRQQADLSVRMTARPDAVVLGARGGSEIEYRINVSNQGPGTADRVVLTDVLPAGVTLTSPPRSLGKHGTCGVSGGSISCDLRGLRPGEADTVIFSIVPTASGIVTNTATANSPQGVPDPDTSNNVATATVTVADADQADLRVQMTAFPTVVTPGAEVTYTIVIDSAGPADVQAVRLVDVLPAGVSLVSVSGPPASKGVSPCTVAGNTISCEIGVPRPATGHNHRVIIVGRAFAPGVLTNTASVTAIAPRATVPPVGDPNPSNNSATASVTVFDLDADSD
jgi:uncharacterized repeat protein (TIGR01451 family)